MSYPNGIEHTPGGHSLRPNGEPQLTLRDLLANLYINSYIDSAPADHTPK